MSYSRCYKTASFTVVFLFLLLVMHEQSAGAETGADQIQNRVVQTIETRQETQKKENVWAGTKAELTARYRSLKTNQDYLERLKLKTERALSGQKVRLAEFERKIKESARIREELQSYLESVVAQLEGVIKKDIPFLLKERDARLVLIKETLALPDKPAAEKYRRVMEALQIEAEYGRTVEVYQDTIDLNGQSVLIDILRLGRLSLFCQTQDNKVVGHYDQAAGRWLSLSSKYRREINKAVDMARRQRSIDLVRLPIGRIILP
ncbi:MAG: DUF3450 domain-containing protein [Deltaproteobacteria bacterium]|nr:DUF3450 domain-containing protein [Deltaproteobacteria bacterium]